MKPLSELTHYEVLEVGLEATPTEIERAFRVAQATWGDGALATYSLFEDGEAEAIRERIELAYRVLSDESARQEYDARLGAPEVELDEEFDLDLQFVEASTSGSSPDLVQAEIESFDDAADESGRWNGARLRRARLRRGIDLEKIAEVTKINPTYLRCIEEDQYEDLPAIVYVRGFVVSYARCLGLEAEQVAGSYMELLRGAEPEVARKGRRARA